LKDGTVVQRWLCRNCWYRFSETRLNNRNSSGCIERVDGHDLKTYSVLSYGCRVGAGSSTAKNSARAVQALKQTERKRQRAAGATEKPSENLKGRLVEFLWWMKKQGYAESTISSRGARLRRLINLGADLYNPESVKEVIATQKNWGTSRKEAMVWAYDLWAKWLGIKWERPIYKTPRKLPFIPLEREIDDLIASCNKHVATFLQIAKETGARAGEIYALKWTDMDFETRTLRITAKKGSNPRMFKVSTKLVSMLNQLPKENERIFSHYKNLQNLRRSFDRYRRRAARRLGNPRLLQIHFHTLRHWKGTMEYHKTKDILHVMQILGHREIKNTLLYTQLVKFGGEDEFICRVARNPDEIQALIEAGFEFVLQKDGFAYFRKRK